MSHRGYLAHDKTPPPKDPPNTLGIGLRSGPRKVRVLISEVPLYTRRRCISTKAVSKQGRRKWSCAFYDALRFLVGEVPLHAPQDKLASDEAHAVLVSQIVSIKWFSRVNSFTKLSSYGSS